MKRIALFLFILICQFSIISLSAATPIDGLLERIDRGASKKFIIQQVKSDVDFFELDQKGNKPVIRGNSWVNIATGLNWYLKHHAGIHLTWNQMQAKLPAQLPAVMQKERHETVFPEECKKAFALGKMMAE